MRKNFLLLFLMALLPLAALADNISITPANASKTYGEADPTTATGHNGWFTYGTLPSGVTADAIANALPFLRIQEGENVGTYTYTFDSDGSVTTTTPDATHYLVVNGTAQFTIKKKTLTSNYTQVSYDEWDATGEIALVLKNPIYYDGTAKTPGKDDFDIYIKNAASDA